MNIVLCIEAYKPYINGVVTHVSMLRDSLVKRGHSCLIVTTDPKRKHHTLIDGVLYCPAIAMKNMYGYGLAAPFSKSRMRALRDFKPDVIHIHTELSIGAFGLGYAKQNNTPVCYTLHTMYDNYSHYLFKNKLASSAVKPVSNAYFRYFAKEADVMISPSEKAIDFMDVIGVKNRDITIIPNTIDVDTFNPENFTAKQIFEAREDLGISRSDFVGIFVGRLGKEKSVDVLIDAWTKKFGILKGHKLVIIGDGPCAPMLKAQAEKLTQNIIFTGKIDHSNIAKYLAMSNYYITASLTEMMSISMLEAMAMGLPCVLRYDEQNKNQVQDGVNGFVKNTVEEMCNAVLELSELSEDEYNKVCEVSREYALSLNSDSRVDMMVNLYNEAIKIRGTKPRRRKIKKIMKKNRR